MNASSPRPDLVIGGAPRSGTTFLYKVLSNHPDVFVNSPAVPEPKVCLVEEPAGDAGRLKRYAQLFADAPPGALRVEKTANYFENDDARLTLARLLPNAKFVFIMREPVARAYSNWMWSTRNGLETLPFADAIARTGLRQSPLPPEKAYARPYDYLERGRYGTLAAEWLRTFGGDRVAFFLLEQAVAQPEAFAARLQAFAGLRLLPWTALSTGPENATSPLPSDYDRDLVATLRARFRGEIDQFEALTGLNVSCWRR